MKVCRRPRPTVRQLNKTELDEKAFAQQMIKDHTKANQHLLDLAKQLQNAHRKN
ncbi:MULTISPECIES: DUF4142 domain-containing protein [Pseudomonas]|uniref:DUF4142 domain-containing protein n=1 Tax=Pseudomonas TaxID=286 RepID=UPI000A71031D|nr:MULTISPECIES: DUF4142 domain-containing protein [Pseudomonas]